MTPRSNTFVLFLKKSRHDYFFSQLSFKRLSFVQIFFCDLRKSPEVILGHFGVYGVKFRTSPKADKLYLKMKPLTRTFQKITLKVKKSHQRSKSRKKRAKKVKFLSFSKVDQLYLKMKLLARTFQKS